ncbi:hypothetical protein AMATHDRAFT_76935 [Amanita thiersii Skay4041]|uniref:Carboxylic ester hydrolase n=1 Tax=Amanita thiersii Skay4041 TaxID=703135 RepID=A0A2A9NIE0_9AGAR|nr:hypothetical protein AMATHDRAFT_76935 [Amanita thiersii Skay4041]
MKFPVLLALVQAYLALAARPPVTVKLDDATFNGKAMDVVNKFLGIPYAQPPVGDLRYRLPKAYPAYTGTFDATKWGRSCSQQARVLPELPGAPPPVIDYLNYTLWDYNTPDGEDCLTLNVIQPKYMTIGKTLPVVVVGGFEMSGSSNYDGTLIVKRSMQLGEPVIYVSMNYRVGLGFLGGDVMKNAGLGNLGLHDQRLALRWVKKYISTFGGDPNRVTIWGQSGGAMSVAMQMLTNGGDNEGLFHGAFMLSGGVIPFGWIDGKHGQRYWDGLMRDTGCCSAKDKIECLRQLPYKKLKAAIDASPDIFDWESVVEAWIPRADGVFLKDTPQRLLLAGSLSKVPFVIGDVDDEATLFTFANLNITTNDELGHYASTNFFPDITPEELKELLGAHADDPTAGSPFDTGTRNALTPEFKRESAAKGDLIWQTPRRFLLTEATPTQDCWSFLSKRNKNLPFLGAYQGSDLPYFYDNGEMQDYLIYFVNTYNPNRPSTFQWPKYNIQDRPLLTLWDGPGVNVTADTFREPTFMLDLKLGLKYPL